jgi:hypothetical protein
MRSVAALYAQDRGGRDECPLESEPCEPRERPHIRIGSLSILSTASPLAAEPSAARFIEDWRELERRYEDEAHERAEYSNPW